MAKAIVDGGVDSKSRKDDILQKMSIGVMPTAEELAYLNQTTTGAAAASSAEMAAAKFRAGEMPSVEEIAALQAEQTGAKMPDSAEMAAAKFRAGEMPSTAEIAALNSQVTGNNPASPSDLVTATVTAKGAPDSPGAAWVWNGMEFTRPPKPSDGKAYTWDDNNGWVADKVIQTPGGGGDGNGEPYTAASVAQMIADAVAAALAGSKADAAAAAKAARDEATSTALDDFRATLTQNGLGGLVDTVNNWIVQGKTAAQIKLDIRNEGAYKDRFPGMAALSAKNRAITEGDYINMERGYEQVLRAYGLDTKAYGGTKDLGTYIANEVSAKEFEDRVSMAANRVAQQSDVVTALSDMYGVDKSDAIGYLLNPEKAMNLINKQVRASEIAAAALDAKFTLGQQQADRAATAEALIAASGTTDLTGLKQTFGRARTLATTQQRLAYLENQSYNEMEAVNAELGQNQEALLASQRRAARETARFGGSSGVGGSYSLRRESSI